eukprot:CAMPEP_0173430658 /NCGR_PEP_ID=MMETSP1357-20121228/9025_1 /TAXON_ID=77926 /ORGANISM="Hemiselmis rufescens, Strain PCC563" /LENGTH=243 /DNA_ID=CAMNT_0014395035 /DNA_START=35 /DNA_END=763 /DNA_ORIENTATION=+
MGGFDSLVVVDFQVTTGEDEQEIIEFAWSSFDLASNTAVDERRLYCKPSVPKLNDETIGATDVEDADVESAESLQGCVQEFNDYLYKAFTSQNKDFCLCTFGEAPLKKFLLMDAKSKSVKLAAHFMKFVDVRSAFKSHYPKKTCASAVDCAAELGLTWDKGSSKGAAASCKVVTKLITHMLSDGVPLTTPTTIPDGHDPEGGAGLARGAGRAAPGTLTEAAPTRGAGTGPPPAAVAAPAPAPA